MKLHPEHPHSEAWQAVAECVDDYESDYENHQGRKFPNLRSFVEKIDASYRVQALAELVRVDLELRWQAKQPKRLEEYLASYPELGTSESVSVDLVCAEIETRRMFDKTVDLSEFESRFPRQNAVLKKVVGKTEAMLEVSKAQLPQRIGKDSGGKTPSSSSTDSDLRESLAEWKKKVSPTLLPQKFGRYRVLELLGRGGMGAVYLALDTELSRKVALKVPHFEKEDDILLDRFGREAQAAATIRHPNICPIYDVGQINGIHYLTMAFIEGRSLSEMIESGEPLPIDWTAQIIRKLALALEEAHEHGVIHRDLKPANVIIDKNDEPLILDFGLARRIDTGDIRLTKFDSILGTPAYMSPERITSEPDEVGPSCDIYSLGVLMYELLTGQLPFRGSLGLVLSEIMTREPTPPSELRSDLDLRLEAICQKAMAKKPEDRYRTAGELAEAIEQYSKNGSTIPSPGRSKDLPPESSSRSIRWPWIATFAATVMIVALAAPSIFSKYPGGADSKSPGLVSRLDKPKVSSARAIASSEVGRSRHLDLELYLQRASDSPDYRVLKSTDVPVHLNDLIHVKASLPRPAFAYLYWYDSKGKPTRLWPERVDEQTKVETFWHPELDRTGEDQQWREVVGEPGNDFVLLAFSDRPLSEEEIESFEGLKADLNDNLLEPNSDLGKLITVRSEPLEDRDPERGAGALVTSPKRPPHPFGRQFEEALRRKFESYVGLIFPIR